MGTTTSSGLGLDFGFFNNRLTGSVDYFQRDNQDLISSTCSSYSTRTTVTSFCELTGKSNKQGFEVSATIK
jgi:iron complex outermembrane receptor protein